MAGKKRKRKVALPCDRTGEPIQVGDVLQWDDGMRMRVGVLNWYGDEFHAIDAWTAEGESDGDFSDNLAGSLIVWRGGAK